MGRLVNPDEFVSTNVEKYIERSSSNYTTLLETTPVFITYFHQNRTFTTNDLGLENVEDDLGRDSSIKYEVIRKLPAYGVDNLSLSLERGDIGLNSNIESEIVLLPDTIKPYPNDYFSFDDLGDQYLFKITEIQEDMIKSKPFYRVSYRFSKYRNEEIDDQIVEDYTVNFNNIGTDNSCVIKTSSYLLYDEIEKLTDSLIKFYVRNFYDKMHNVIILRINTLDIEIYSQYLNKFIIDNDVFKISRRQDDFYSTVKLLEYIPTEAEFDAAYEKTLYYAVSCQDKRELLDRYFTFFDITYPHAPWLRSNKKYKGMLMIHLDDEDELRNNEKILEFIDREFFGRILLNNPFINDKDYYMENLIIKYINGDNTFVTKEFLDAINNNIWRKDMRAYVFIPLIIFILRKLMRHDQIKQN